MIDLMFIEPMLAEKPPEVKVPHHNKLSPSAHVEMSLDKLGFFPRNTWVGEEKLDGHRLIVKVGGEGTGDLFEDGKPVRAWSRDGLPRVLPRHILDALGQFPDGTYDGELLVPGKRSYGVTELVNAVDLVYVVFDVLILLGQDVMSACQVNRRAYLLEIFSREHVKAFKAVRLVEQRVIQTVADAVRWCEEVWERDGEGLILKKREGTYRPKKRSKEWLKLKALRHATLTITGYEYGKLGPYAKVTLVDDEGIRTTVKVLDTATRNRIAADPQSFIGRRLCVDYQERTPDGLYRHIRWDRLEDE